MKIKDYKCKCGCNDFFFADKGNQKGIYCTKCGKWLKWADKDEKNLVHCLYTDEEIAKSFIEDVEAVKDQLPCGEQMDFPNTFDKFAKEYGFKDKNEIYTNGSELIPVFRVKQWLEHISTTMNDLGVDCISREQAQTEIEMNASRYTIAKERGGMGQVEWSDQLIKVSDAVDIIRNLTSVTPQPCEDSVSRKAINGYIDYILSHGMGKKKSFDFIKKFVANLPTVTPQESKIVPIAEFKYDKNKLKELVNEAVLTVVPQESRKGHWIGIDEEPHEVWECDHCGFVIDCSKCIDTYDYRDTYKFCPNCGADMRNEEV